MFTSFYPLSFHPKERDIWKKKNIYIYIYGTINPQWRPPFLKVVIRFKLNPKLQKVPIEILNHLNRFNSPIKWIPINLK